LFYGYLLALAASIALMFWIEPVSGGMLAACGVPRLDRIRTGGGRKFWRGDGALVVFANAI